MFNRAFGNVADPLKSNNRHIFSEKLGLLAGKSSEP